jgi:hypothetical protein
VRAPSKGVDLAAFEPVLRARLPDLEQRVAAMAEDFGGLLDRSVLLLMLADEHGLLPVQSDLADFGARLEPTERDVAGVLERLAATRPFRRADGTLGFVADAEVRTAEGLVRVVLWDAPVREVQGSVGRHLRLTCLAERTTKGGERALHSTRATKVVLD